MPKSYIVSKPKHKAKQNHNWSLETILHKKFDYFLALDNDDNIRDICSSSVVLLRLPFQATIYHMWRERNGMKDHQPSLSLSVLPKTSTRSSETRFSLEYHALLAGRNSDLLARWISMCAINTG